MQTANNKVKLHVRMCSIKAAVDELQHACVEASCMHADTVALLLLLAIFVEYTYPTTHSTYLVLVARQSQRTRRQWQTPGRPTDHTAELPASATQKQCT